MKSNRAVLVAIVAVGTVVSAQCSSSQTSMPTAPGTGSAAATVRLVGQPTTSAVEAGKIKVCKSSDSTLSGSFTVDGVEIPNNVTVYKTPFVLAPGECLIVAESQFRFPSPNLITVTETSAGFVSGTDVEIFNDFVNPPVTSTQPFSTVTQIENVTEEVGHTLTYVNIVQVTGDQGCTPGYWGRPQHLDSWVGYAPGSDFDTTFGVDFFSPDLTLLEAVNQGGGGLKALGRHAVAALLNTSNTGVAYAYTTAQVLDIVQGDGAYTGLSVESRKNLLATANEKGCPLN